MAGDDWMDAYIAEALKSTGTRKAATEPGKPATVARPAVPNPVPVTPPQSARAHPHTVVSRTSSQTRPPITPTTTPVVARTPTPSSTPRVEHAPLIARIPTQGVRATFDDSPIASIDRARPPKPTPAPPPSVARTATGTTPPPAVARTRSSSLSPLAAARARDLEVAEALPRHRAPHSSSTCLPQAFDDDFSEDTVPEAESFSALTDQDDRGVRRS